MRLAGATTIDQANRVLRDFLPRFNSQFGVSPAQPGSTYRQLQDGVCFDAVLCFKYLRTVARDNTVQFDGATAQLMPDTEPATPAPQWRSRSVSTVASSFTRVGPWRQSPLPLGLSRSGLAAVVAPTAIHPQTAQTAAPMAPTHTP